MKKLFVSVAQCKNFKKKKISKASRQVPIKIYELNHERVDRL